MESYGDGSLLQKIFPCIEVEASVVLYADIVRPFHRVIFDFDLLCRAFVGNLYLEINWNWKELPNLVLKHANQLGGSSDVSNKAQVIFFIFLPWISVF